jgi:hypothetical protein
MFYNKKYFCGKILSEMIKGIILIDILLLSSLLVTGNVDFNIKAASNININFRKLGNGL